MQLNRFPKGPKSKRLARERLSRLMWEWSGRDGDASYLDEVRRAVPEAWLFVEMDCEVDEPKDKVTLYLDRSVAKLFRAMGHGYQARINRILTTWVQMKMAELRELEMELIEAIDASASETNREEPEEKYAKYNRKLLEHWAYLKGVEDAEMRLKGGDT